MFRRIGIPLLLAGSVLAATLGLTRLSFDTDILSMMPGSLPEVRGLRAYQEAFSKDGELVAVIEGGEADEGSLPEAAETLGRLLVERGLVADARWQPRWDQEPEAMAEVLAYLWLNGKPEETQALVSKLSPVSAPTTLKEALGRVATSLEGLDMVKEAHDPFGFLAHPAVEELMEGSAGGGEAFESEDGRTHLLFLDAPQDVSGYAAAHEWIGTLRGAVDEWRKSDGEGLTVRFTGEPAFASDIGTAMERDLGGSIGITLGLIGILFWWMQRRLSLLLGLTGMLVLIFGVALGVAGWVYGELSIIALSSMEILIGLSVDYGLVICQEAKVARHDGRVLRKACVPPVFFGALTTAVVFLSLNLGGLPGTAQLGSIVAVGLLAASVLMLLVYLPYVVRFGVDRAPARGSGRVLPGRSVSLAVTAGLCLAALAVLFWRGLPQAEFDAKIMHPRESEAMETFERMGTAFPVRGEGALGVVIEARDDAEMSERLREAERRMAAAEQAGLIAEARLPSDWWPDAQRQEKNRPLLAALAERRQELLEMADGAGFTGEGLALGRGVLEALGRLALKTEVVFPDSQASGEIMRLFLKRHESGGGYLAGSVTPAEGKRPADEDYAAFRALTGDGIWLSGWDLFRPAVAGLVRDDLPKMLVPMMLLLVGMMAVIFRRAADVGLALGAMLVSTLLLLAVMSAAGIKWNFVNLMATPLLLGTGIDYAIHVTLSLRRTGGDFRELWQGTGKALLFCGASNVIGFGSLINSSSDALVSLGVVAVIGILLCMAVSIFLLPGWRHRSR
jgi:predicted RND superfamily exporter protein